MKPKSLLFAFLILYLSHFPAIAEINELPTVAQAIMIEGLFSERAEINDKVEARLSEPLNLRNERTFVPIGSIISGKVVEVREAGRGLKKGKVKVTFNQIQYPNGYILGTEGYLLGNEHTSLDDKNIEIEGKSSWKQKLYRVGKLGAGVLVGGPIGAAAAAGTLIFDKGGKVRIKDGDEVRIYISKIGLPQNNGEYDVKGKVREEEKFSE